MHVFAINTVKNKAIVCPAHQNITYANWRVYRDILVCRTHFICTVNGYVMIATDVYRICKYSPVNSVYQL